MLKYKDEKSIGDLEMPNSLIKQKCRIKNKLSISPGLKRNSTSTPLFRGSPNRDRDDAREHSLSINK